MSQSLTCLRVFDGCQREKKTSKDDEEVGPTETVTLQYVRVVSVSIKRMLEKVDVRERLKSHRTPRLLVKPKCPTYM